MWGGCLRVVGMGGPISGSSERVGHSTSDEGEHFWRGGGGQ